MELSSIIDSITCPITGEVMKDPVQGTDGQTYEREAIIRALSIKCESPITREYMTTSDLRVNASIRFLCDKYHSNAFGDISSLQNAIPKPKISSHKVIIDHSVSKNSKNNLMFTFNVNQESMAGLENDHLPQDVVLVIDHSGSMNLAVQAKDSDGNNLENGLSIQDIVNHAAKTVACTLDKNSRLGLIIFDNTITTLFNLMPMTERNNINAMEQIKNIKPCGQTNIWGALDSAIGMLNGRDDKTRNGHIMILTDGAPNISPARGEVETLKRLRKTMNFTSPIYTFGFGYNLKRGLLYDLCKYANGANGHIPDGGMIATVFCNFIGTILSTVAVNLQLHLIFSEVVPTDFNPVMGDFCYTIDSDSSNRTIIVDLGTIQIQQVRNIILNVENITSSFSYYYTYKIGGEPYKSKTNTINKEECKLDESGVNIHYARCYTIEQLRKIVYFKSVRNNSRAQDIYDALESYFLFRDGKELNDTLSLGIIENIIDQVKLAITNETYYTRWGEFYIDQLSRSLNQQIKPNFKDQGCLFGGEIFTSLVDKASDIFDTLEPPEPSLLENQINQINQYRSLNTGSNVTTSNNVTSGNGITAFRTPSLASYNNASNSCFAGECIINLADGSSKMIKNIKKGDKVISLSNPYDYNSKIIVSTVKCLLQTNIICGIAELVTFENGLQITPWHPIIVDNTWIYPSQMNKIQNKTCCAVYSIVLDNNHTCYINSTWCITLGHGYTKGILNHEYYGTEKVIQDLQEIEGWNNGHIIINNGCIIRNHVDGRVVAIHKN